MQYRADIDGLRAIAVLPIVLFHLGVTSLSGGFVGVDVFFVISGYLITSLVLNDIDAGRFSFKAFYMKRIRRLGPALLVTLLATLLVGIFILSPSLLEALAESSLAALLSVSNILFWSEAGYFDADAIYKPLLHTWSLGVEEQFYVVWPVLLLLVSHFGRKALGALLLALSVASLIASEMMLNTAPETVFFLAPFRVFEFAFGAGLALFPVRNTGTSFLRSSASVTGLIAILASAFLYTKETRFPGIAALVPCVGAALIIWAGPAGWMNKRLTLAPLVYIGRISYSLYLVHWPVVVYYAYLYQMPENPTEVIGLIAFVLALASVMYFAVEQPFRKKRQVAAKATFRVGNRAVVFSLMAASATLVSTAVFVDQKDGLQDWLPSEMIAFDETLRLEKKARRKAIRQGTCHFTDMSRQEYADALDACAPEALDNLIVVYGDSHAAGIWSALSRGLPDRNVMQITAAGCSYGGLKKTSKKCTDFAEIASKWIIDHADNIEVVVYSQRAKSLLNGAPEENLTTLTVASGALENVRKSLEAIQNTGTSVIYWGPRPEFHPALGIALGTVQSIEHLKARYALLDMSAFLELDTALKAEFKDSPVTYISSYDVICAPTCTFLSEDGGPLIVDYGHWTTTGGDEVLRAMRKKHNIFGELLNQQKM